MLSTISITLVLQVSSGSESSTTNTTNTMLNLASVLFLFHFRPPSILFALCAETPAPPSCPSHSTPRPPPVSSLPTDPPTSSSTPRLPDPRLSHPRRALHVCDAQADSPPTCIHVF
ncbi:uncharacterized protein STEHIDRAFT_157822 [Stereum hirsutum FP-91666 SS1]|uniref:uncharacterized protein n=1 Tax=Stereum hirsutum (strain FP-91666) TaxID=721885 RepID=UPI0004449A3B|nr:uncharacterized protein STEHIDRAFT_157822 [Stereum hirsutum FP-91666 SS1]EIM86321.1 hypothetical protein STEHIDRAFT_157822 [Stereum hirsutum FP-91666 SS1]